VLAQANSFELKKFGLTAGLTNYAASYCTGLLIARRLLDSLKLNDKFKGIENADGEFFDIMAKEVDHTIQGLLRCWSYQNYYWKQSVRHTQGCS